MNLNVPVNLTDGIFSFDEYCSTIRNEQITLYNRLKEREPSWPFADTFKIKINESGDILPFYGDTVVMPLSAEDIDFLTGFHRILNDNLSSVLAKPLSPSHFHLTIHDLNNPCNEENPELLNQKVKENKTKCEKIFKDLADYFTLNPEHATIELTSTMIFPSRTPTILVGFLPKGERDYQIMMNLRNLFDSVVHPYRWIRPHVTLAYFKYKMPSADDLKIVKNTLDSFKDFKILLKFNLWDLAYQTFNDMDTYNDIFRVADFR